MSDRLRAIDALIAEHVFGWVMPPERVVMCPECGVEANRPKCMWEQGPGCPRHAELRDYEASRMPSRYSAEPAASKRAREKMAQKKWDYTIASRSAIFTGGTGVRVAATFSRASGPVGTEEADTEELAVALAILAALQIEAPE